MTQKDYEKILIKLGFAEISAIKKDFVKDKFIISGTFSGQKSLLKIVPITSAKARSFKIEKKAEDLIETAVSGDETKALFGVGILDIGEDEKYSWMIRRFYEGEPLSLFDPNLSMFGYDILKDEFAEKSEQIIPQILSSLEILKKIPLLNHLPNPDDFFEKRFKDVLENYDISSAEETLGCDLHNQVNFYNSNKEEFLSVENKSVSTGDLSPANILVSHGDSVVIFDFELFNFDNWTMDLAYFWLMLWRYPDWQKLLIEKVAGDVQNEKFFRLSIIKILLLLYPWPYDSFGGKDKNLDKSDYLKSHAWTKYLIAAGESFESLISVKEG